MVLHDWRHPDWPIGEGVRNVDFRRHIARDSVSAGLEIRAETVSITARRSTSPRFDFVCRTGPV